MTVKEHIDASAIGARLCEAGVRGIVLGFPKSGTTAFAQWLDGSPRVDISNPKETFQLCPEYATNLNRSAQVPLADSFHGQVDAQLRVEATTLNVYSESLRSAAAELPELKVILLTREPVATALSWHNQMRQAGVHFDDDFQTAWQHAIGSGVDAGGSPSLDMYHQICAHGHWSNLWIDALGHDRVLLLRDQELRQSADALREKVNAFFGEDLDIPGDVPTRNVFSSIRFPLLYRTLRHSTVKNVVASVERKLPIVSDVRRYLRDSVFLKPTVKQVDKRDELEDVKNYFASDEQLLEQLLTANRSRWHGNGLDPTTQGR